MNTMYEHIRHPFPPLYDSESQILILGSLPSVKSREQMFFYGHPQNRFWKVMAAVLQEKVPQTIDEKKDMLHRNHIAPVSYTHLVACQDRESAEKYATCQRYVTLCL